MFPKLKALAKIGEIPKYLANVLPPVCVGCAFGAMTKVPWRNGEETRTVFKATKTGTVCFRGPDDIHAGWILCTVKREFDKAAIQRCHNFC